MNDITSANSVLVLTSNDLYPAGVQLQQFSADSSISQADEEIASDRMGVDGHMAAGWIPAIKAVTIALEPSSPSVEVFDTIYKASQANRRTYSLNLTVNVPSIGKTVTYKNGILKNWKLLPDHQQVLGPINAVIDFESVE